MSGLEVKADNYIEELKPEEIKRFAIAQDKITIEHKIFICFKR